MVSTTKATSFTELAKTPIWSNEEAKEVTPYREIIPYEGLNPTTPQKAAGCLTDPPVSVPKANGTYPALTAAADPHYFLLRLC